MKDISDILNFPEMRPDEEIRSLVYRYHIQTANLNISESFIELFGRALNYNYDTPPHLNIFAEKLCLSTEELRCFITNYTYNPLFKAFLNVNHGIKLLDNPTFILRELSSKLISPQVRYCPKCAVEDFNKYGHVYSHRMHQISVLSFCKQHYCELIVECPVCGIGFSDTLAKIMMQLPECPNGHSLCIENPLKEIDLFLLELHEFIEKMLNNRESIDSSVFFHKLYGAMGNKGYVHFKGAIYKTRLLDDFITEHGENLSKIGLCRENILKTKLVTQYFNVDLFHLHPLLYISLVKWLYISSDSFLNECQSYAFPLPFGYGPWQCKNKICPSVQNEEKAIKICKRHVHEHITGVFECPICGFTYSRRSKQLEEEDEEKFTIDSFGQLWMQKVIEGFEQGKLIQEIADSVYSSDISVVKHYKIYKNEIEDKNFRYKEYDEVNYKKILIERKKRLLEIIKTMQDITRPQIRIKDTFIYDWLMKNARDWMEEILPARKINISKQLNYAQLDQEMFDVANKIIPIIYTENPRSKINYGTIVSRLDTLYRNRLNSTRKTNFIKTTELIKKNCESDEEHLKRIFPKVINWFMESRYKTLSLKLLKMKFVCYRNLSNDFEEWLINEIEKIPVKGV